ANPSHAQLDARSLSLVVWPSLLPCLAITLPCLVITTATELPTSRATSTVTSQPAAAGPVSATSTPTPCAAPARPCSPRSTLTPGWQCASCGTARSLSRWRSTPTYPMRSPATRCVGSESNWMGSHCCTLLLHEDQRSRFPHRDRLLIWEPPYGIEP